MNTHLSHRKANIQDLPGLIQLLSEDELGQTRENATAELDPRYLNAFQKIDADPNQYLMVVEDAEGMVGTCHLTLMPSLTFTGQTRLQIEAVRIAAPHRGKGYGEWMMQAAQVFARTHGATILQLTTNKKRPRAKQFYERLGFEASHEGMKLYIRNEE